MDSTHVKRIIATFVAVHFNCTFEETEGGLFSLSTKAGKRFSVLHPAKRGGTWTEMNFKGALVISEPVWRNKTKLAEASGLAFSLAVADKDMEIWLAKWRAPFPLLDGFNGKNGDPLLWVPTDAFTNNIRDRGELEDGTGPVHTGEEDGPADQP